MERLAVVFSLSVLVAVAAGGWWSGSSRRVVVPAPPPLPPPPARVMQEAAPPKLPVGCRGMTWVLGKQVTPKIVDVGNDATTEAYQGDTSCNAELPVLCIRRDELPEPAGLVTDAYHGWSGSTVGVTASL